MTEYSNEDKIKVFKEENSQHENAPHWTGSVTFSEELLQEVLNSEDKTLRVALWKTHYREKKGFFLAGQVSIPLQTKSKAQVEDDGWDDDEDF